MPTNVTEQCQRDITQLKSLWLYASEKEQRFPGQRTDIVLIPGDTDALQRILDWAQRMNG